MVYLMPLKGPYGNNIILHIVYNMKKISLKIQHEKMPKCGIATPNHIFNTMFSIPRFQHHIFNTTCHSGNFCCFHEKKIVKLKKTRLQNQYFDDFFPWKRIFFYKWIILTKFFTLWWFHEKLLIFASKNTTSNSYSKPYDNRKCDHAQKISVKLTLQ